MAKSESNDIILGWSTMWSSFRSQPDYVKKWWMKELSPHLKDAMKNCTDDVQEDMLRHAPIEVQKCFGYVSKDVRNAPKPAKKIYNDQYRSDLLNKIRGTT